MEQTSVQKMAKVLRVLVMAVFVLNLLVMPLVPGLVVQLVGEGPGRMFGALKAMFGLLGGEEQLSVWQFILTALCWVWTDRMLTFVTVFFWLCGVCTAVILWQAKKVLDTLMKGSPFQQSNARALKRAAVCCWVISGASLVRLVVWLWTDGTLAPLFTYTTLFVPAFFMAGLLFLVMSALFGQAAELKEDQDLTI